MTACRRRTSTLVDTAIRDTFSLPTLLIYGVSRYALGSKQVFTAILYHGYCMLRMPISRHVASVCYRTLLGYDAPGNLMFEFIWCAIPLLAYIGTTVLCRRMAGVLTLDNLYYLADFRSWFWDWFRLAKAAAWAGFGIGLLSQVIPYHFYTSVRRKMIEISRHISRTIFLHLVELCHTGNSIMIITYQTTAQEHP